MIFRRTLTFILFAAFGSALLIVSGCQGRAASAAKLFEKGEYETIIAKYPDLEVAQRARVKIADKLLAEKKYDVVLKDYADTRAAYQAKIQLADEAFRAGRYQMVLDSFPGTPAANSAKQKLADSLMATQQYDLLLARYPETPQATQVKEQLSQEDLAKAKKLKGEAKKQALEALMKKYAGTAAYKEASTMLADIRAKENPVKK